MHRHGWRLGALLSSLRQLGDQQTNSIFDKQIDKITNKKNTMGLIEQIAEMRVQEAEERTNN